MMPHMSEPTNDITLRCPAKLNLTLAVGAPRDDGLHPIASVMVAIDFGDDLHLRRLVNGPSTFDRCFAEDAPKPQPINWPIESDLIYRAHALLEDQIGRPLPVACVLDKRVPAGAGLGGGSANAAGMMTGLRELFGLAISDHELLLIAEQLGADVVFAVHALLGQRAALVSGIGQTIEPLTDLPAFDCVLVFPEGRCPTAAVYHAFDQLDEDRPPLDTEPLLSTWRQAGTLPTPQNDLTEAAITICPTIKAAIEAIAAQGLAPRLTGSGSALFAIVESQDQWIAIADTIRKAGLPCIGTNYSYAPKAS